MRHLNIGYHLPSLSEHVSLVGVFSNYYKTPTPHGHELLLVENEDILPKVLHE